MTAGLFLALAFLLACEKRTRPFPEEPAVLLKELAGETLELFWQTSALWAGWVLLAGIWPMARGIFIFYGLAGAYLLSSLRRRPGSGVFFLAAAALVVGVSAAAGAEGLGGLFWLLRAAAAIGMLQALCLGMRQRLALAPLPTAAEGLPAELLGYFLTVFALWAAGL